MAEPRTVKLRTPIQLGSRVVEELTFRPPTGKDFRQLPVVAGFPMDTVLALAGRLTGQPDPVIDKLTGDDLAEVVAIASDFMPGSPPTTPTSSQP